MGGWLARTPAVAAVALLTIVAGCAPAGPADPPAAPAASPVAAPGGAEATAVASADHTGNPSTGELAPAAGVPTTAAAAPRPVELSVPDLGIEASPVVPVGVDSGGELEVPAASDVGWYRFGSPPGEPGSSVLAAHIAYDGVDGVFRHLAAVEIGAAVEVGLEDGTTVTYRIVGLADYEKAELPLDDVFDESGPDRLVLITCGGDFNPELRSYRSNVVAYAEPG